jgi:Xaa-Pro aminopeptidase
MAAQVDEQKVAAIKEVVVAAQVAVDAVVEYIKYDGTATAEIAHTLIDTALSRYGCVSPEGHIVACGVASAEPHEAGSGQLLSGVPIVIDIFPQSTVSGYWADITRTVCRGTPSAELEALYAVVRKAQELAISLVRPGAVCADIHHAVADFFTKAGYETRGEGKEFAFAEGFVHGLGHGVGTQLHDAPRLRRRTTDVLSVGDVIAVEPGLYYHHLGGVRLEDLVLVTETGPEVLTNFPKMLLV